MTDEGYDELSTKREMVRLLAKDATAEQLDAAIYACMGTRLNDQERCTALIQTIYASWYERLVKTPRPPGADSALTWGDVEQMFRDVLAVVGGPRRLPSELFSKPAMSDKKSDSQDVAPTTRLAAAADALGRVEHFSAGLASLGR